MDRLSGIVIILLGVGIILLATSNAKNTQEIKLINEKLDKLYAYSKQLNFQIDVLSEMTICDQNTTP